MDKNKTLIKLHNSPIAIADFADELDLQDIEYEIADTGVFVSEQDYDYAVSLLTDMELGNR